MQQRHKNADFRAWKHEITDLIERINKLGYDISCKVATRGFYSIYGSANVVENRARFNEHFADTAAEIDLIVKTFEKYGDPTSKPLPIGDHLEGIEAKGPLPTPKPAVIPRPDYEKMTWADLRNHVPLRILIAIMAAVGAAVSASCYAGWLVRGYYDHTRPPQGVHAIQPTPAIKP